MAGRLRPDFLSRCKWDSVLKACTGYYQPTVHARRSSYYAMQCRHPSDIVNGRTSFPSGHSSTAFSGMAVLSLWLAGQTAAWCFNAPCSARPMQSRLASLFLTLLPLFWAAFVAISRVEDNVRISLCQQSHADYGKQRHHAEDVVVGSMIGVISSMICYHIFWPSPFSAHSFKQDVLGQARYLYVGDDGRQAPFELARMDEDSIAYEA